MRNAWTFALVLGSLITGSSVAQAGPKNTPGFAKVVSHAGSAALTHSRGSSFLRVRLYDAAGMPAVDQAAALRAAAGVLAAAGIDVEWLPCAGEIVSPACNEPLATTELSVRLVRLAASLSADRQLELGYALVDTHAHDGKLATVYVDRVEWLAGEAGADSAPLTGLAVAHEIGHLLLGTNAHARAGLMRAVWSRTEIEHATADDWLFSRRQASQMRTSLAHRKALRSSQRAAGSCLSPGDDDAGAADCAGHATACAGDTAGCAGTPAGGAGGVVASLRSVAAGADR